MHKDMAISALPKEISLGPGLDRAQAEAIFARGKEAVIFALLEMAKQLAEARNPTSATPSTPSGMVPVYEKPAVSSRKKRPGREKGHPGSGRARRACLDQRLRELIETDWRDPQAARLVKRLRRHQNELFTFLDHADVPFENNHAERAIRPAVIIRKNSYANRSLRGSDTQAVLRSIFRTLKQRGYDLLDSIVQALKTYLTTGLLPSLPP
jgi:transposase